MIEYLAGKAPSAVSREVARVQARAYAPIGIRPWAAEEFDESMVSPFTRMLLARDSSGAVQGFLYFNLVGGDGEILALAVDPDCQRQGIASDLFDMLKNSEKIAELRSIILEVAVTNARAIFFYEMLGFSCVATRPNYYCIKGNRTDAQLMKIFFE